MLTVGVPREVKTDEHRVAITPDGVSEMTPPRRAGARSSTDAGADSSITDDDYRAAGAEIVAARRRRVGARRPRAQGEGTAGSRSSRFLRPDLVLFTYLHLAAYPEVARALLERGDDRRSRTRRCSSRTGSCRCSRR